LLCAALIEIITDGVVVHHTASRAAVELQQNDNNKKLHGSATI
jgi:hypothetical protein